MLLTKHRASVERLLRLLSDHAFIMKGADQLVKRPFGHRFAHDKRAAWLQHPCGFFQGLVHPGTGNMVQRLHKETRVEFFLIQRQRFRAPLTEINTSRRVGVRWWHDPRQIDSHHRRGPRRCELTSETSAAASDLDQVAPGDGHKPGKHVGFIADDLWMRLDYRGHDIFRRDMQLAYHTPTTPTGTRAVAASAVRHFRAAPLVHENIFASDRKI